MQRIFQSVEECPVLSNCCKIPVLLDWYTMEMPDADMLVDLSQLCFRKKECGLLVKPLMCGHKLPIEWPCDEMYFRFWLFSVGLIFQCWRFSLHFTSCLSSEFNFLTLTQATKNPQSHVSVSSQVSHEKTIITNNPQKWEATFFFFHFCMYVFFVFFGAASKVLNE